MHSKCTNCTRYIVHFTLFKQALTLKPYFLFGSYFYSQASSFLAFLPSALARETKASYNLSCWKLSKKENCAFFCVIL